MTHLDAAREFAINVVKRLQDAGFQALFAGGCVRDQLMGFTPKDYDVATDARPAQVRQLFGMGRTLAIGESFGVITVIGPKTAGQIDVATFRQDDTYSDGRHPDSVRFSTPEQDAQRRDFTINGLFYDPLEDRVWDYVEGQLDIRSRTIRAIGDPGHRIAEDHLRMLRAVRFAARFEFQIEPQTFDAIRRDTKKIVQVSGERIANELRLMLGHSNRHLAFSDLLRTGLLVELLPERFTSLADAPVVLQKISQSLKSLDDPTFEAALALIVYDLPIRERVIRDLSRRWRLSNNESSDIQWIAEHIDLLVDADRGDWPTVQRALIHPRASSAIAAAAAIASSWPTRGEGIDFCRQRIAWAPERLNPPPLIDGHDLQSLQLGPGPIIGEILSAVRRRQLSGEIVDRQQALAFARTLIP